MKRIILDLYKHLAPLGFSWIDLDRGQLNSQQRPPVNFPCCLIRPSLSGSDINDEEQLCILRIELKIAFDDLTLQTDFTTAEAALQSSLSRLDLIDHVHGRMQGYYTERIGPCSRVSQNPQEYLSGVSGWNMVYESTFTEETE